MTNIHTLISLPAVRYSLKYSMYINIWSVTSMPIIWMFSLLSCLYIHLGVNECCLTPNDLFVSYTITRTTYMR